MHTTRRNKREEQQSCRASRRCGIGAQRLRRRQGGRERLVEGKRDEGPRGKADRLSSLHRLRRRGVGRQVVQPVGQGRSGQGRSRPRRAAQHRRVEIRQRFRPQREVDGRSQMQSDDRRRVQAVRSGRKRREVQPGQTDTRPRPTPSPARSEPSAESSSRPSRSSWMDSPTAWPATTRTTRRT